MGCEQSSQYQKLLVRLETLSVVDNFNFTLASINNNSSGNTAALVSGVAPTGAANLFPNTDIDGAGRIDTASTTQFISDANVVSAATISDLSVDATVFQSSSDMTSQEIKEFLSKDIVLLQSSFTTTDTVSTQPRMFNPSSLLSPSIYKDKMKGFLGFRATLVLRLVINATRFQQGRYMLYYVPTGGAIPAGPWIDDHMATLVQRTTLPHVEIDLNCDTEAILRIPYSSCLNFCPLNPLNTSAGFGTLGAFGVAPYSTLVAASGISTCPFTLYGHFEDVILLNVAIPQSGRAFGSTKKRSTTEVEQDSANIGPISSSLIRISNAANIIGKIPLLSSYANSVSWFADIGASAAKVFGWRKPVSLAPSMRVTQNFLPYSANNDGPDMSFPLSLSYENAVGMAPGFSGTDVDEMDFSFLCTIPAWWNDIQWTSAGTAGAQLLSFNVSPSVNVWTTTVNSQTWYHMSPLQFVADHFQYWRGSLVYKFKFVKTEFHSGRLSISFSPRVQQGSTVLNYSDTVYLHRQIIDIRETNEFTFVVPFVSEASYLDKGNNIGTIYVHIVDPLMCPNTVAAAVTILLEKSGGSDIEFAVPDPFVYSVYNGATPQSGNAFEAPNVCSNYSGTIGSSSVKADNGVNALNCIGEKISSVRSLLKLPSMQVPSGAVTTDLYLHIQPFAISTGSRVAEISQLPPILADMYSNFSSCYVFSRGGVRIKFLDNVAVTATQPVAVSMFTDTPSIAITSNSLKYSSTALNGSIYSTIRNNMPVVYYREGYSGEIQVPQYMKYHSRNNIDCYCNSAITGTRFGATGLAPRVFVTRQTIPGSVTDVSVLRSVSDDFNLGSFVSVPPMVTTLAF